MGMVLNTGDGILMRGVNKLIICLIIWLSFISCKSKRDDIISFVEYDYSTINDYPSLYEEFGKQGCKPGVTEYYYPISRKERLLIVYHIDSKTLYIDVFDLKSENGIPSDNIIQKYLEIFTKKYGKPDYGIFCKHKWNNFNFEEYYITLPYWKIKNSKVFLYRGDENNDSDYHFCFIVTETKNDTEVNNG